MQKVVAIFASISCNSSRAQERDANGESSILQIAGIVAEYNPFHLGHEYHLDAARSAAGADALVVALSSNFVQRGEPALADKATRTRMALRGGADLVLELPVVFSCHNAGLFANAAVDILAATGVVSSLSFGMETPEVDLQAISAILNAEPPAFRAALKAFLGMGHSFVEARSKALDIVLPGSLAVLKKPNNNLALAYVKRIQERRYAIHPLPVARIGAGYHARTIAPDGTPPSATAIRAHVAAGGFAEAEAAMPKDAAAFLRRAYDNGHTADGERFWRAVKQALVRVDTEALACVAEMREGLENRMIDAAYRSASMEDFLEYCTSKRYPKGRIRRYCAHWLLNLTHGRSREFQNAGPAYIRVLGANKTGREVLRTMRHTAALPVISRSSAPWSVYAAAMMRYEHRATELWENLTASPRPRAEANFVPIMTGALRGTCGD